MATLDPEIIEFITTSHWRFAKTMPQWPHEYVVRSWAPDKDPVFQRFVILIRKQGYDAPFLAANYRYLEVGDWKYWTMGEPPEDTTIINRAKVTGASTPIALANHTRPGKDAGKSPDNT